MAILAVGDIVSGISGDDTALNFQASVGTSVIITWCNGRTVGTSMTLYNGATASNAGTFTDTNGHQLSMKMFITNTNYLSIAGQGGGFYSGYTGIQIS